MLTHLELMIVTLVLTFAGQVHTGRIIGGQKVEHHSRPYMVMIHKLGGEKGICGGFLLNQDFVMTAAHCKSDNYSVFLGIDLYTSKAQPVHVEQDFPHECYTKNYLENDIMLLKLKGKANFNAKVKHIDLAGPEDPPAKSCSVSGWGKKTRDSNRSSRDLMEVNVTVFESENSVGKLYFSESATGPAKGDSGGPLVCNGKAYGVVSLEIPVNSGQGLYVYTKIQAYREWIESKMSQR